ncbi:MAG: TonB-dependent receptor [Bacteroidaceae bacterium]|nr:TonB-dependent receptor [Bacteroidaceae bacterium]
MKKIALLLLVLLTSCQLFAQTKLVGTVLDGSMGNEPLPGATIRVKGTSTGTVSDIDGKFEITIPSDASQIVVSSIGFATQTLNIKGKSVIKIILIEDSKLIEDIIVVGYGTMKKSDLSGAVASIKADELMKGGSLDIAHGLQGKIAGVQIQQSDGAPGGGMSIVVRGANSFSTSSQPLYIIDGVPFAAGEAPSNGVTTSEQSSNPLASINPHDIESIEILKDASATAIYGSRGANGVVLITTKRGKLGKTKVEVNATFGIQKITKKLDMLDPKTYATYINEQTENDIYYNGSTATNVAYPGTWGYKYKTDGHADYTTGTYTGTPEDYVNPGWHYDEYGNATLLETADWQDEIFQTASTQDYNVSVSSAGEKGWYLFSANYADQEGIIKNSGYERYTIRSNMGFKINKWLEMGTNTSFTNSTTNFANTLSYNTGVVRSALLFPVTYGPNMDTTQADDLNWLAANPAAYVNSTKDELKSINWFSSSYLEAKILPELKFRQNIGLSYSSSNRGSYYDRHTQEGKVPTRGKASKGNNGYEHLTSESILTFDKVFNDIHHLNVMGAFTAERSTWHNFSQTFWDFNSDITKDNNTEYALYTGTPTSDKGKTTMASFLGRINYTFMDKYLLTASLRRDGSSVFTDKNKWATFPSAAIAWRASEEDFVKNLEVFDNLKIRASYGATGNQGIGAYRTIPFVNPANYSFTSSLSSGYAMPTWRGPTDNDLKWETTKQWNIGLDFAFLNSRLSFTVDYYHKNTYDLLQNVQIPSSTGFTNKLTNSGNITNNGLEMTASFLAINNKDWKWNINANISFNKNEINGLSGDQYATTLWYGADNVFIQRNGCPMGAIYGYIEDGFYDNTAEVRADPIYKNSTESVVQSMVGEIKYRDINNDDKITEEDRTIIGDTNPDFTYGFSTDLSWKDFTLSMLFQGSKGNDIFNGNLQDITLSNIGNITTDAYNSRWTADNYENAKWPKASGGYTRTYRISNRYVEDASYFRCKSLSLSYNWKEPLPGIEKFNIAFSVTNLFTITNYSWYDPDVNAFGDDSSRRGVDIYSYPLSRTYSLGFTLSF